MKIKFLQDYFCEVVTYYDADLDAVITEDETFKKDEVHNVDLLDNKTTTIDIQFGDGSCLYGLTRSAVEILEQDE